MSDRLNRSKKEEEDGEAGTKSRQQRSPALMLGRIIGRIPTLARPSGRLTTPALWAPPSALGLILGSLFLLAALTPSMIPRNDLWQGVVAGLGFAMGYGLGALLIWIGRVLEFLPPARSCRLSLWAMGFALACMAFGLFRLADWQNGVRAVMHMPPVETVRPLMVSLIAFAVVALLLLLARLFRRLWIMLADRLVRVLPMRAALLAGFVAASMLFWSIGSGVLVRGMVDALDNSYAGVDALIPVDVAAPETPLRSGSADSLVSWKSLGARGREHMLAAPSRSDIMALTGRGAREPVRVYVGVNSAPDPAARARLALAELKRTGAFDRHALVIATPTGTGWIDPSATAPLEYLLHGDVATVSVQYSYLPSWLSLLVEAERGAETAREVFRTIYGHWLTLPENRRPRLYLFGLSLGALNSDLALNVYDILAAPVDGALWAGPPFPSQTWNMVVRARHVDSPVWAPRYSDGRMFRFATSQRLPADDYAPWGPMRVIYLQYPSDPIVFFEPAKVMRPPQIVSAPRAPDLSPDFIWIPLVSYMQMVIDMMIAAETPSGFGHVYAADHYLNAWLDLIEPEGWGAADQQRLRRILREQGL